MCVALLFLLQNVYDPLKCEEGASFYSLRMVGLLRYFRKHHMQPPPHALNAPLEKGGPYRVRGGVAAPWATHLATTFGMWAPGWAWSSPDLLLCWCSALMGSMNGLFACVLVEYAFSFVHFGVFSCIALQNMYIPKLMENVSCKP